MTLYTIFHLIRCTLLNVYNDAIDGQLSKPQQMEFGLPQGSIVEPLGFSLYVLPVGHIIKSFILQYHMYVDDVQLYTYLNPNDHVSITLVFNNLSSCIDALTIWMQNNMLKLNDDETEFLLPFLPI